MPWNLFGVRKEKITPEYLGQCLADEIIKNVFQPSQEAKIPYDHDQTEYFLVRTFAVILAAQQALDQTVADRALRAMHHRAWTSALGVAVTDEALEKFNQKARERYTEYSHAVEQPDGREMMLALKQHVAPSSDDFKVTLDLFFRFSAAVQAFRETLTKLKSMYDIQT
jgi:hypothetical protein